MASLVATKGKVYGMAHRLRTRCSFVFYLARVPYPLPVLRSNGIASA